MIDRMKITSLTELEINITDPRQNNEFLWLSYSINSLKPGQHERVYWITLEKRCLSLFHDKGYDLQAGAWYCLIASQLYSWEGLADASWRFAECFVKEKKCWPPASACHMRAQIIDWYIRKVIPVISLFPSDEQTPSSLCMFEDSLELLSEVEHTLLSGKSVVIKNLLSELRCRKRVKKKSVSYPQSEKISQSVTETFPIISHPPVKINRKRKDVLRYYIPLTFAFACGVLIQACLSYLEKPEIAWRIKQSIPESSLSDLAMEYAQCSGQATYNDNWIQLKQKIEDFEKKLNTTEKNGGYITISELKSIAYDMKNILLKDGIPVSTRIALTYNNQISDKKERELQLEIIEHQIDELQCQLGELRTKH